MTVKSKRGGPSKKTIARINKMFDTPKKIKAALAALTEKKETLKN